MAKISSAPMAEALTFDDVLLKPGHSTVMPSEVDVSTKLTRLARKLSWGLAEVHTMNTAWNSSCADMFASHRLIRCWPTMLPTPKPSAIRAAR